MPVNPLTMGVTMLGTAEVVMLAGGELRPAGKKKCLLLLDQKHSIYTLYIIRQNSVHVDMLS